MLLADSRVGDRIAALEHQTMAVAGGSAECHAVSDVTAGADPPAEKVGSHSCCRSLARIPLSDESFRGNSVPAVDCVVSTSVRKQTERHLA